MAFEIINLLTLLTYCVHDEALYEYTFTLPYQ